MGIALSEMIKINNMGNKLTNTALELLLIEQNFLYNMDYKKEEKNFRIRLDDFEIVIFEQMWGSTALGFDGCGGQAMTKANTYVFIPVTCHQDCFVYFGARLAYHVPYSEVFMEDVRNHRMASRSAAGKYLLANKDN